MKPDGGPAFPCEIYEMIGLARAKEKKVSGMTLRDYFGAAALTGMLKDHENTKSMWEAALTEGIPVADYIARSAYSIADAMLAERDK